MDDEIRLQVASLDWPEGGNKEGSVTSTRGRYSTIMTVSVFQKFEPIVTPDGIFTSFP